ncbi:MAG: hypothetical protein Q7S22_04290 [Candidatus Micrarchaeota archaeon]|nr:hypothetical protein [Candidatus Micrarchaeota archaeon]
MHKLSNMPINHRTAIFRFSARLLLIAGIILTPKISKAYTDQTDYLPPAEYKRLHNIGAKPSSDISEIPVTSFVLSSNQRKIRIGDHLINFSLLPDSCSSFVTGMSRSIATLEIPIVYDITDSGVIVLLPLTDSELRKNTGDEITIPFSTNFLVNCHCVTSSGISLIGIKRSRFLPQTEEDKDRREVGQE